VIRANKNPTPRSEGFDDLGAESLRR